MANFVICADPDADRRRRFIRAAQSRLAPFPGLATGALSACECEMAWAVSPRAPFAKTADADGASLLFGEMIDQSGKRVSAENLRERWSEPALERMPAAFDGYYAACVRTAGHRLIVGADLI